MRKFLKIFLYVLGSIIVLLLGVVVWLNTGSGKNFVRTRVVAFLHGKLKTEVSIGELGYGLPKYIVLKNVLFKDQKNDTLLAIGNLKIDIDMLKLLKKQVSVQQVVLEGVHAHIYRNAPDTNFNFTYIIDAFTSKSKSPKPKNPKDTTSSFSINLDRLALNDIHARFDDYTGGTRLAVDLDHLNLKMKKLDLDKMQFHIKELVVVGLQSTVLQDTSYLPPKHDASTKKTNLQLAADDIDLQKIAFHYNNSLSKMLMDLQLGKLKTTAKNFDLARARINLDQLTLDETQMKIVMGNNSTVPKKVDTLVDTLPQSNWHVVANEVKLNNVNFALDNNSKPRQPKGMDYSHLDIRDLVLNSKDILYTGDTITGNIKHLSVKEKSGLDLKELRTVFAYNRQGALLNNLYLQTSNTVLQDHLEIHYPSLEALKTHLQNMQLKVNLKNSIVGISDVLLFAPTLENQELFRKNRNAHLRLDAVLAGYLSSLNISNFYLSGFGNTEVQLNGRLSGLPDANKINYNLHIAKLQSSRNDLNPLLPQSLQQQIRLPDRFGASGQIAGTIKDYNANLLVISSDGNAYINGLLSMSGGKGRERYDMHLRTDKLNIGRILRKDSLMGTVTATVAAKGESFDVKTMNAALNGVIETAYLKGYNYHQITFNGKIASKTGEIKLVSADPNVRINLDGHADFTGKYAAAKIRLQMDSINFQALKLYKSELRIHGTIKADFPELNPDYPRGTFIWTEPIIVADGKKYLPDSMVISSRPSQDTGQNIVIFTDVMKGTITGHTPLTKIGAIIQDHINRHYAFRKKDSTGKVPALVNIVNRKDSNSAKVPANYDLKIAAHIEDKPLLHVVLSGITYIDTVAINAVLDPVNLYLKVDAPQVVYGGSTITNAQVLVNGADSAFTYKVTVDEFAQNRMKFWYANINGNLDQNEITTNVSLSDSAKKERFALSATMQNNKDTQIIQLHPGLKLNYETWQVNEPNRIVLAKNGMYVQNFQINNNNQYIKINSEQPKPNTPLRVDISNFMLADITRMISSDTLLANGVLGGNIVLERTVPTPALTSTLQIQNLSVMGDTIGNLKIDVNHTKDNELGADVAITGRGNDVDLKGTYYLQNTNGNDFDFMLALKALNMQTVDGVTFGKLKNSSGYLRGDLHIQGTVHAPLITGELRTDQMVTTVSMLNAYFKMPSEKITFTKDGLRFENFRIYDSSGNNATITGSVATNDLPNMTMDLHVTAKNWRALHSTSGDNKTYYGDLLLSTNLNIKGSPSAPDVDGSLNILKGTKATYVMPETAPQIESHEGIVKFFSMKDTARYRILKPEKKDTTKMKFAAGSNINVNIGIDKSAEFSVVIDKASGDFLKVRGDGALNASVTPDGNVGITGTYQLHGGEYQLNYNFIKRLFKIQDGSSITFAGDPSKMQANITAIYVADVAPYDLVQQDIPDQSQLNYYKERLPFDVVLNIRGQVLHPSLTFNITLPDNTVFPISYDAVELVRGKLNQIRQDTAELNKQVFALLILNHFVAQNPFASATSSSATFIAKQSVSRFIGEQLNEFASHLIKGVDLSVDLASSEDYTTGSYRERTDLNLAASKRLLNDRLKITVGNDFELQGPQTSNSDQSNLIPSNLAADYLLTADGKYTVQAYRKNYDEGVLEGYVTETGLNFIVSLDYNKFKNIFRKKKHKKEQSATAPEK